MTGRAALIFGIVALLAQAADAADVCGALRAEYDHQDKLVSLQHAYAFSPSDDSATRGETLTAHTMALSTDLTLLLANHCPAPAQPFGFDDYQTNARACAMKWAARIFNAPECNLDAWRRG